MQITESLFVAYCHCAYEASLKSKGEVGEVVDYEVIQKEADSRFRDVAIERLLRSHTESQVTREPASLRLAVKEGVKLIVGATVEALGVALRFDLLQRKRPVKCIFKISRGVRMMGPVTDLSPETAPCPSRPAKSIGPPSWPISAAPG